MAKMDAIFRRPWSFCFFLLLTGASSSFVSALNQEGHILLQMKQSLEDVDGVLSGWGINHSTPCGWSGVTCNASSSSVVSLDLTNANLSGPFPAVLCRLPNLSFLSLAYNYINGTLPPDSVSPCRSLRHLDLSQNCLVGSLPTSLSSLPYLRYLDLTANNFSGPIPSSFADFPQLEVIGLVANQLAGPIPPFFSSVSSLRQLNLSYNPFEESEIPAEYGNLTRLEVLWLSGCNLVGEIPPEIGNLKNLTDLDLAYNGLTGFIPEAITLLSSAVQVELYNNSLSGPLPARMSRMTSLRRFDASMNMLEGEIPVELCALPLESLNLYENRLEGELPGVIANSPYLYELRLFANDLSGSLPSDLGRHSPLKWVDVAFNHFSGGIPENICGMGVLLELLIVKNSMSGKIPAGLADCSTLTRVRLAANRLSGEVPAGVWGLPNVYLLELSENSLSGEISPRISSASSLSMLRISNNRFAGTIPTEISHLEKLIEFSGSNNLLNGSFPRSIVNLAHLGKLDIQKNRLVGNLPSGMQSMKKINYLNLADNGFTGAIPREIGELPVLNYLDLSGNSFSGQIPVELQNLKLNRFNLSDNRLQGKIPPLYDNPTYRECFLGNPGLCGRFISVCSKPSGAEGNHLLLWLFPSILILTALVLVVGVGCFCRRYWDFKQTNRGKEGFKWTLTSFHKLGFCEFEILGCLDEDNVIGTGASGKVYRAVLSNEVVVAVKKLWGAGKKGDAEEGYETNGDGFEAEVSTLGKIRHKNIVKLWCCCISRDCKLLVYEYMCNGSLGDLLHSPKGGRLDWLTRFGIALDAAEGLSYLHHDCVPPIVHRDVKSNNILLDEEFGAKVADFGLAKIVQSPEKISDTMSMIAGSCGYIAPEYGYTLRVNEKSDIYSFGVVILELVTGKRPVDPNYGEKDLVKWVCTTIKQKGIDHVIDPKLDICFKEEICRVLSIGMLCTNPLPINRPTMRRVVQMLLDLKVEFKHQDEKKGALLTQSLML